MKSMMKMTRKNLSGVVLKGLLALPLLTALNGCTRDHEFQPVDMWNRTRLKPYEGVGVQNISTARSMPSGVIARGQLQDNEALYTGKENGALVTRIPISVTEGTLRRGQERYTIYCAPCHGGLGDGKGVIITRGFAKPPDYYADKRVLNAPVGHYYDVITNGYGVMYSYADRVPVNDRWAIAAYIRLLQRTRAQGANTSPTIPGGGVYEKLTPVKGAEHSNAGAGHGTGHQGEQTGEITPPGSVQNSFIPGDDAEHDEHKPSGTGAGQNEPEH